MVGVSKDRNLGEVRGTFEERDVSVGKELRAIRERGGCQIQQSFRLQLILKLTLLLSDTMANSSQVISSRRRIGHTPAMITTSLIEERMRNDTFFSAITASFHPSRHIDHPDPATVRLGRIVTSDGWDHVSFDCFHNRTKPRILRESHLESSTLLSRACPCSAHLIDVLSVRAFGGERRSCAL